MNFSNLVNNTGHRVATELGDLPSLKNDFVRVVHRTNPQNVDSILKDGLKSKGGIEHTSDCFDEDGFWELMAHDPRGNYFGNIKIIMDMPIREYSKVQGLRASCYNQKELNSISSSQQQYSANRLVCPSKYIVGVIDHTNSFCQKCIDFFRKLSIKNPALDVEKTDLRIFNQGRPHKISTPFGFSKHTKINHEPEIKNDKCNTPSLNSVSDYEEW